MDRNEIVVERINVEEQFFEDVWAKIEKFYIYGVLLELIGKWYTRKPIADSSGVVQEPTSTASVSVDLDECEKSWCYCQQPSFGTMIGCDNSDCTIQWFHCECLRIRCPPKGKWFCPSCRKLSQLKKSKK